MHISDATIAALAARGWHAKGQVASKLVRNAAPAGTLSNGSRFLMVEFDQSGRWLSFHDGFRLVFELDSRDWTDRPEEFADEIERCIMAFVIS